MKFYYTHSPARRRLSLQILALILAFPAASQTGPPPPPPVGAPVRFGNATNYAVGLSPNAIVTADFNHDGKLDLATANSASKTVSVLSGLGTGAFAPRVDYALEFAPTVLVTGDFNNDSVTDLVAMGATNGASLLASVPGFVIVPVTNNFQSPSNVVAGDFNKDGKLDLATRGPLIALGRGNGTFTNLGVFVGGIGKVAAGDINSDGNTDIVTTSSSALFASATNKGNGTFSAQYYYPGPVAPTAILLEDVNKDGRLDAAITGNDRFTIWTNGGGNFTAANNLYVGLNGVASLTKADFRGDGSSVWVVRGIFELRTLVRNPDNNYALGNRVAVPQWPYDNLSASVVAGDFNDDGRADLALLASSNSINVMLNETQPVLEITWVGAYVQLSWPARLHDPFQLETTTNLSLIDGWQPMPWPPVFWGNKKAVADFTTGAQKFYRLRKP